MGRDETTIAIDRKHAVARAIIREWRRLTREGAPRDRDRSTLLAVSGGADSSALAIACAAVPAPVVIAHIVHDLRPEADAQHDHDHAAELARRLGRPFVSARVAVRAMVGNTEANARSARYEVLAELASARGCRFIATGHHADDQLETLLMKLARGAGPRGMAGIAPSRPIAGMPGLALIRPMLTVRHADALALCDDAGWTPAIDATNAQTDLRRNALRAFVIPELARVYPEIAHAATRAADTQRVLADLLTHLTAPILAQAQTDRMNGTVTVARAALATVHEAVRRASLIELASRCGEGSGSARSDHLRDLSDAICSERNDTRVFRLGGVTVTVSRHDIRFTPA